MTDSGAFDIKKSITSPAANLFDTLLDMEAAPLSEDEADLIERRERINDTG